METGRNKLPTEHSSVQQGQQLPDGALRARMNKAEEFRAQAAKCIEHGERSNDGGKEREQWQALAKHWSRLAEHAEQYPEAFSDDA